MEEFDLTQEEEMIINCTQGQNITIKVMGNLTSGYNWYIKKETYDEEKIKCTNKTEYYTGEYRSNQQNDGVGAQNIVCGAPGYLVFNFLVKANSGSYTIELNYKRHFETEIMKFKKITFNLDN